MWIKSIVTVSSLKGYLETRNNMREKFHDFLNLQELFHSYIYE